MTRGILVGLAVVLCMSQLAGAAESRFSGKYMITKPHHNTKAKKVPTLTSKEKGTQKYNPKEFKLDDKAQWK